MHRLFTVHKTRRQFYLDGEWQFLTDPEDVGVRDRWCETFPSPADYHFVPSCWNNELGLYHYEGTAWYRRTFHSEAQNLRLVFHGVNTEADVYLDGRHLGYHYGGFLGFGFTVTGVAPGEHVLTVRVNNTHNETDTIPLAHVDWFHYGGIIRSVEVMELGDLWLQGCRIDYVLTGDDRSSLTVSAEVENLSGQHCVSEFGVEVDGRRIKGESMSFAPGVNHVKLDGLDLGQVERWTPEEPAAIYHYV